MKKIMFNDSYGLTKAVLEGRKTMTRRVFKGLSTNYDRSIYGSLSEGFNMMCSGHVIFRRNEYLYRSTYKVGEIVAVAQSYLDCYNSEVSYELQYALSYLIMECDKKAFADKSPESAAGWTNKMFVRADLMPHQIRITNVNVEHLQDISDEDCIREGILEDCPGVQYSFPTEIGYCGQYPYGTARDAFAALIDKVSGKGTWKSNPWVFVYEFELVK